MRSLKRWLRWMAYAEVTGQLVGHVIWWWERHIDRPAS